MKKPLIKIISFFCCFSLLFTSGSFIGVRAEEESDYDYSEDYTENQDGTAAEDDGDAVSIQGNENQNIFNISKDTYASYLKEIQNDYTPASGEILMNVSNVSAKSGGAEINPDYQGSNGDVLLISQDDYVEWEPDIPAAGIYSMEIKYCSYKGKSGNTVLEMYVNGKFPFREAGYLEFAKVWENGEIKEDTTGNDVSVTPTELVIWQTVILEDPSKNSTAAAQLALNSGKQKIKFAAVSDSIAIEYIKLIPVPEYISYNQYKESVAGLPDNSDKAEIIPIEAEKSLYNSDISITPLNEPVSPNTSPQKAGAFKLNIIGSDKWQRVGQKISWPVKVTESGNYKIAYRYRQKDKSGIFVTRSLKIDGVSPFKEAQNLQFDYNTNWSVAAASYKDGEETREMEFYFEKDREYVLTLQVELGDISETLSQVEQILASLNQSYLDIFMIVGTSADKYRDYGFEKLIPNTIKSLDEQNKQIKEIITHIEDIAKKSDYTALLNKLVFVLDKMVEKPETIAAYFDEFKTNIGALGTWLSDAKNQPLELDKLYIVPSGEKTPKEKNNFFKGFWFNTQRFFMSFVIDYSKLGVSPGNYDKKIKVWLVTGRDQAQIIRRMADEMFSKEKKIAVDIELVSGGTLLPSVLAGVGPDVSLMNGQGDPINYAVRNAVLDLNRFSDLEEVMQRFQPNSMLPYQFNGKTYALPETISFSMFFYRKDIFEALEIDVPKTWDDLVKLVPKLQRHKMNIAFPTSIGGFNLALYQQDIPVYLDGGRATNYDSESALKAFNQMCETFTMYRAPIQYDFINRFRTGEMPCGIQDYMTYNQLNLFAPEIKGLWDFIPCPGVTKSDGTFENTSIAGGSATMIMSSTKDENSSWEFMKWWLSAEVQSRYAIELESVLGPSAKYATANIEAFDNLTWTSQQRNNILAQLKDVKSVPEVPGGYYTSRIVDFAFSKVYNQNVDPRETLLSYIEDLNEELTRKRAEFGLN